MHIFFTRLSSMSANVVPSLTLSHVKAPDSFLTHSHPLVCSLVLVRELSKSPNPCPNTLSAPVCLTETQGQRISLSLSLRLFNSFFVSNRNMAVAHVAPNLGLFLISFPPPFTPLTEEITSNKLCSFHFFPPFSLLLLSATISPLPSLGKRGITPHRLTTTDFVSCLLFASLFPLSISFVLLPFFPPSTINICPLSPTGGEKVGDRTYLRQTNSSSVIRSSG